MKAISLTSVLFMLAFDINAQVTLEMKYDYSTSVVKFETLGYKYFLIAMGLIPRRSAAS